MTEELATTIERLAAAAAALEHLATRLTENGEATIGRIVAQVEQRSDSILEQRLAAAEQQIAQRDQRIAELEAAAIEAAAPASRNDAGSRKTSPPQWRTCSASTASRSTDLKPVHWTQRSPVSAWNSASPSKPSSFAPGS